MKNPITKEHDRLNDEDLQDIIIRSVSRLETQTGLDIFANQREEKHPFDRQLWDSFNHLKLDHRPVSSLEAIIVSPASELDVWSVPLEWVETNYLQKGLIYMLPFSAAFQNGGAIYPNQGAGGSMFISVLGTKAWIPAYWKVRYTSGFPDGVIPHVINELVGIEAAMETLSILASTYGKTNSQSLGIDGLSQSISGPGQDIFAKRIEKLKEDKALLANRLKAIYGTRMFVTNV